MPVDDMAARGFEAGAAAYELARPGYPDAAIDVLAQELGVATGTRVCDLAAGTGKLTRRLVELGASVVAVEPVNGMREQLLTAVPGVEALDGTAESIPVPDGSVDVVTVAQAFHWFDAPVALAEIARVLKPGGGLALLWNERDESVAWVDEMSRIIHWHERTVSRYQHVSWPDIVAASERFTPLEEEAISWEQPMTRDVLADRVRSISYIAVMPSHERERLVADVAALVARRRRALRPALRLPRPVVSPPLTPGLLGWWEEQRRELPWRQTREPWEVLVCEVMAQQTQVAQRGRAVAPVPRPLPDAGGPGGGPGRRGHPVVEWHGVQPPRPQPAPVRTGGRRRARWPAPGLARRPPGPARHRPVHRPGRAGLLLRARPRRRRHQHGARAGADPGSAPQRRGRRRPAPTRSCRPATRGRGTRRCSTSAPGCAPAGHLAAASARSRTAAAGPSAAGHCRTQPMARRASPVASRGSTGATGRVGVASWRPCAAVACPSTSSPTPWDGPTTPTAPRTSPPPSSPMASSPPTGRATSWPSRSRSRR